MQDIKIKEQVDFNKLPEEAVQALKILDELENFTAELRKKLMASRIFFAGYIDGVRLIDNETIV